MMKKLNVWIVVLSLLLAISPLAVLAQDAHTGWNGRHTVQAGETLFRIALRYGVTTNALASANGLSNPNLIYAGQVLRVPTVGTPPTPTGPRPGDPFDVQVTTNTSVYEGQSFESPIRYVLPVGTASASGRSPDSAWIYVRSGYGVQGWVWAGSVVADRRLLNALPVMSPHGERPPVSNLYTVNLPYKTSVHLLPNASAPVRANITPGMVIANGRSLDGQWLSINAYNGIEGWVRVSAAQIDPSMLYALPVTFRPPTSGGQMPASMQASIVRSGIPLRAAPGGETPVTRSLSQQSVTVLGRSWDSTWVQVRTADQALGWVWLGDTNLTASQILTLPSLNG